MSQNDTPNSPLNEPVAEPATGALEPAMDEENEGISEETPAKPRLDPTRYGDWELNGKCVDF